MLILFYFPRFDKKKQIRKSDTSNELISMEAEHGSFVQYFEVMSYFFDWYCLMKQLNSEPTPNMVTPEFFLLPTTNSYQKFKIHGYSS